MIQQLSALTLMMQEFSVHVSQSQPNLKKVIMEVLHIHLKVFIHHALCWVYVVHLFQQCFFISDPPTFHRHPQNISIDSGYPSAFKCSASGFPRPSINWYTRNGSEILPLPSTVNEITMNFTGAEDVTSQLIVIITVLADSADYICVASNPVGSSTSDSAFLTVIGMLISFTVSSFVLFCLLYFSL